MKTELRTNPTDPAGLPLVRVEMQVTGARLARESLGDIELTLLRHFCANTKAVPNGK